MRRQSLDALGAVPLSREQLDALGLDDGRIERYRRAIPEAVAGLTEIVVDNPGQCTLLLAGSVVLSRAAFRIVQPRTALQGLALAVVLQVGIPALATQAMERGWLRLRVRDADGCLVPLAVKNDPGADPA